MVSSAAISARPAPAYRSSRRNGIDSGNCSSEYGGNISTRVTKLETTVEFVQRDIQELKRDVHLMKGQIDSIRTTDFRILFGSTIAVALGLAGLMAKGFHWV